MEFLPSAFGYLNNFRQFIVYSLTPSKTRKGKFDKLPVSYINRKTTNAHDSSIWTDANTAIDAAKSFGRGYGVGFVLTESDPFFFIDIDNCLEPCNTKWSPLANELLKQFQGAAVEVSSSGRGLHLLGVGTAPPHGCRNNEFNIELYTSGRFIALTGTHASGSVESDHSLALIALVTKYFANAPTQLKPFTWTNEPCAEWQGHTNDEELLQQALKSQSAKSVFGNGASFRDLWEANGAVLATVYPPSKETSQYNESSADMALAQHLAFWTGNDCERMYLLMMRSGLRREKYDRADYLPDTIEKACSRQTEWVRNRQPENNTFIANTQDAKNRPVLVEGNTYLSIEQQRDLFTGCIYVMDDHKVLIPGGYMLNPERFRVAFGGYSMPMDNRNERTSRNAWEVFTESQAFRGVRADTSCFKPNYEPGAVIEQDGQRLANIWWPIKTLRTQGDPTPFLKHIALLCPDPRDQMILLSYLAAVVQYKGYKFQWCPLIQGVEGNGKTLLTRCVAFAIGDRYTHYPKAAEITSKFNDWLYCTIFVGVEDIYVPDARLEIMEALKPMITSERQEIEPKGGNKITRDVCANFIINTNHKEGLRKTRNDRRFAPFYTAQQSVADLERDKMTGDYFPNMYRWLRTGGLAIVSELLHTFEIPIEFNPALGCDRAPITQSTESAIKQGIGGIEQDIQEAIEQGSIPGFKGGFVSSMALDKLLERLNASRRVPHNKRRELMQSLGYDWHPDLKDGRVNNNVIPDGGKPRLYVKHDSIVLSYHSAAEIAKAYEDAQK